MFDGIEAALDLCRSWYDAHEESKKQVPEATPQEIEPPSTVPDSATVIAPETVESIQIYEGEPIMDRKSTFAGRACRIHHPDEVKAPYQCDPQVDGR